MTGAPKALSPAERAARVVLGQSGAKVRAEIEAAIAAAVAEAVAAERAGWTRLLDAYLAMRDAPPAPAAGTAPEGAETEGA